ncbi:hypothetical protein BDW02DRAFT_575129, partial [Decorospora gaudefroyi]
IGSSRHASAPAPLPLASTINLFTDWTPPLGPPGGTYPLGMAPSSYRMLDIKIFKGDVD